MLLCKTQDKNLFGCAHPLPVSTFFLSSAWLGKGAGRLQKFSGQVDKKVELVSALRWSAFRPISMHLDRQTRQTNPHLYEP